MRHGTALASLAATAVCGTMAQAGVEICNDTAARQSVALGYEALGGVWTSEGWWSLDPGSCKLLLANWTPRQAIYYRATIAGGPEFDGPYAFCTQGEAFTIAGDKECRERGFDSARFRKVVVDGAEDVSISLASGDLRGPDDDAHAEDDLVPLSVSAPFAPGSLGEPFAQIGIFGGCYLVDGLDYCEFEAEGWRWHAYYGGGTSDSLLDALQNWPAPLAVTLEGDILSYGDITVEMALSQVAELVGGDPFAGERQGLQGEWQSADDPRATFRVTGSNVYDYYDGVFQGHHWLTLTRGCEGQGVSVGLIQTTLETRDSWCLLLDVLAVDRIELINPGRGNILRYHRTGS